MNTENKRGSEYLFIGSFKSKRGDGITVKTLYGLGDNGLIFIEQRLVSKTKMDEFTVLYSKCGYHYQCKTMAFKFDSFFTIANALRNNEILKLLDPSKILRPDEVLPEYKNDKTTVIKG